MKTPSSILKVITISVFTILIALFVCYRVGAFDSMIVSGDPENIATAQLASNSLYTAVDTPVVPKDSIILDAETIEIMSSSKSMAMPRIYKQDTVKKVPVDTVQKKEPNRKTRMSSSKSGIIYEPEPAPNNPPPQK